MATANECKAKSIVTTKLMSDGNVKIVASKAIQKRLRAALDDCCSLKMIPQLSEKASAAETAIDAIYDACVDDE